MKKGISHEMLKLLACVTMLIDHTGYMLVYPMYQQVSVISGNSIAEAKLLYMIYLLMRCIGRLAFPIFAFLLVEGFRHTRNRKKYALRLALSALLAEIPFNLAVSGSLMWRSKQSIMITLLLGFCALYAMERCKKLAWKPVAMAPFAIAAQLLHTDYGWGGVVLIAMFELCRYTYNRNLVAFFGMLVLFHYMPSSVLRLGSFSVPIQAMGALSMLFIAAYGGRKLTGSKLVQLGFYLFYPVHLLILYLITLIPNIFQIGISILSR